MPNELVEEIWHLTAPFLGAMLYTWNTRSGVSGEALAPANPPARSQSVSNTAMRFCAGAAVACSRRSTVFRSTALGTTLRVHLDATPEAAGSIACTYLTDSSRLRSVSREVGAMGRLHAITTAARLRAR